MCPFFLIGQTNEKKEISIIAGIDWTIETTFGYQVISDQLMSKESGSSTQSEHIFYYNGLLFHSYLDNKPFVKSQLILGFKEDPYLIWADHPDFSHNYRINESLKCIEIDAQLEFPKIMGIMGNLFPIAGYSYLNYSFADNYSDLTNSSFQYHAIVVGAEYNQQVSKAFSQNYYVTLAPLMLNRDGSEAFSALNYGAEISISLYPVSVKFIIAYKNIFDNKTIFFDRSAYTYNTNEIGLSFKANFN